MKRTLFYTILGVVVLFLFSSLFWREIFYTLKISA